MIEEVVGMRIQGDGTVMGIVSPRSRLHYSILEDV